jgi:hypothetical protein
VNDDDDVVLLQERLPDAAAAARRFIPALLSSFSAPRDVDDAAAIARRAVQMRTQLLSSGAARGLAVDSLLETRQLDDAAALVLEPPPASVTHRCVCTHEIAMRSELSGDYPPKTIIHHVPLLEADGDSLHPVLVSHVCDGADAATKLPLSDVGMQDEYDGFEADNRADQDLEMLVGVVTPPEPDDMPFPSWETVWPETPEHVLKQKLAHLLALPSLLPAVVETLSARDKTIITELAVHDVLTGLRILTEDGLLPVRCVREVKRHLARCLSTEAAEQPLHQSLRQLALLDLVALSRYVYARWQRRSTYLNHWLETHELAATLVIFATPVAFATSSDDGKPFLIFTDAFMRRLAVMLSGRDRSSDAASYEDVIRWIFAPDPDAVYRCGFGVRLLGRLGARPACTRALELHCFAS